MKKLIILFVLATLVSCQSKEERIKQQIKRLESKIEKSNDKLEELQEKLAEFDKGEEKKELLNVRGEKVQRQSFKHFIKINGSMEAVESAFISPEMNGQITRIHVVEGQRVKKGHLLVSLNAQALEYGIAELETGLEMANTLYKKQKELWDKKIGSEIQFLQAKSTKEGLEQKLNGLNAQLEMTKVVAPFDGIVDKIYSKEGEMATPGRQLIQFVNLDKMKINADVSENYISAIRKGDSVTVEFPTYPGYEVKTVVSQVSNVVKTDNRTFEVQVLLDNPDEKLKPNMLAVINVSDFSSNETILIPSIMVKHDITGKYIFVADKKEGKSIARKRYIETGRSDDKNSIVKNGLKEGDIVIVEGYNQVRDGVEINVL